MHSYPAAEIFYTFVISSLLAFLQKDQPERLRAQLDHLGLASGDVQALDGLMSQKDWLGTAEKIVFDAFRLCAPYVSPFSINNPGGWRYWLDELFLHPQWGLLGIRLDQGGAARGEGGLGVGLALLGRAGEHAHEPGQQ